ncbi:methyltransferase domain-containing protein [Modestobacter excelsi]|uniref:methyltransferase domain-containing protein n=1 Tax=Modestobacter excelsi TaxID=2213161 RepID=UPI00110CD6C7|nr:methyltransferase domain-containing protein [Modestobacter excelsi]
MTGEERAHGVTPGLCRDYATRTADHQAAFLQPYLRPGVRLLDIGSGPGSITVGLARAVAPGPVTGVDHDRRSVEEARERAAVAGLPDVTFHEADVRALPLPDASFDVAFENNVFLHLADDALTAAREAHRVLVPGGLLAARDVDAGSVVWGQASAALQEFDRLFARWHQSRGTDLRLGRRLPAILRSAGFTVIGVSVSADTKWRPEDVRLHGEAMVQLIDGPFGADVVERQWADVPATARLRDGVAEWMRHPDAFFANVHVEVVGRRPATA